jgi:membrane protein
MLARFSMPLGWGQLLKRTFNEAMADDVPSLAAQQAYYYFFALFPALLALLSIASFFPVANLTDEIVARLSTIAPPDVVEIVSKEIGKLSNSNTGGILTIAFLFTLWSSSAAMLSMSTTLNIAYDVTESRPWWKTRLTAIALTVGLSIFILMSMTLIIAGPTLAERLASTFHLGAAFEWTWKVLQWPVVFILVSGAIALVYYFAPDVEQDWVWITPGSLIATALWVLVSLGFKFYLSSLGGAETYKAYGVIGGVMVLLLWFYLSGLAVLLGAELNAEIEHASPHGKDVGERAPGEKKKIGAAAQRAAEERHASGKDAPPFPDGVNCDLDRPAVPKQSEPRPSELIIGAAVALLPTALRIARGLTKKVRENGARDRAA